MKTRRLCVVSTTPFFGGGEQFMVKLAVLLRGHVDVVVLSPELPDLARGLAQSGARLVALPNEAFRLRLAQLRWLARHRRDWIQRDSAVLLNGRGAAFLAPALRLMGVHPFVLGHTVPTTMRRDPKESLFGSAARCARCIVTVSKAAASAYEARFPWLRVVAIEHWLEPPSAPPATHRPRSSPALPGRIHIAMLTRLVPDKGVAEAIEAVSGLLDCEPGVELSVFGTGPQADELSRRFAGKAWLRLRGHVAGAASLLGEFDVLLSASHGESFSYAVAEGMQAGLVVVASDIPAHRELLGPEQPTGLWFAPRDVDGMRAALRQALDLCAPERADERAHRVDDMRRRLEERHAPHVARARYLDVLWGEPS